MGFEDRHWGLALSTLLLVHLAAAEARAQDDTASPVEVDAGVTVSEQFTDNVFLTANDRRSDFVTLVAPWMTLSYRAEDFRLNLEARAEFARFAEYSNEDYDDYYLGAEALFRVNENVFAFAGLDYSLGHESRESPDDVNGLRPTEFREASGYVGLGGTVGERNFRLGVNVRDLDFDDTPTALGRSIENDDRDRRELEIGGRIGILGTGNGEVFLQGIYDQREYDRDVDSDGMRRSSDGYQAAIGYSGMIGPARGELLLGVMSQDYDDPRFGTTTALDFGADLTMPLNDRTELDAIVERSIEETTLRGASGAISTSAGLRLRHRVASDMSLAAYAFLTQNAYQNIARTDTLFESGLSLRYYLNPRIYMDTNYDFRQRQSDVAGVDFDEHRITLSFGAALDPRYDKDRATLARQGSGGFYAGLQMGDLAVLTKTDSVRGAGGSLTAGFGDHGPAGGIFAGYRGSYGALVLGAELEAEFADPSWRHLGGREFGVSRGNAYALSGIMGLRTERDALLYGRFGVIAAEFDSFYRRGNAVPVAMTDRKTGLLFGVGAEVPLAGQLSGRMEYQLRAYEDYPIGVPPGVDDDNFATTESLVRFGLVYAFGGGAKPETAAQAVDFSGAYAGAQIGHGTLQSDNIGPRVPGNPANPVFTLAATRAGQGFTGGFYGGYGYQTGRFYIGAEAEAEWSSKDWNIERSPTGRVYSMQKTSTVGVGLRMGYVLSDAVLLYGRIGMVRSTFDMDYRFGGGIFDRTQTLDGVRVGGGIEVPINDKTHFRLDYTQTEYDGHAINYGVGIDRFDTTERLFRIGVTRRF